MTKRIVSAPRDYEPWTIEFLVEEEEAGSDILSGCAAAPEGPPRSSPTSQRASEVDDASRPAASQGVDFACLRSLAAGIDRQFRCQRPPPVHAPVAGGWARMGYTTLTLSALDEDELREVLTLARRMAQPKPRRPRRKT